MTRASGKITEKEAYNAYLYLSNGGLSYSGGNGLDSESAIVITATNSFMGVPAEYSFISKHYRE
jgi:hypothetical protein